MSKMTLQLDETTHALLRARATCQGTTAASLVQDFIALLAHAPSSRIEASRLLLQALNPAASSDLETLTDASAQVRLRRVR